MNAALLRATYDECWRKSTGTDRFDVFTTVRRTNYSEQIRRHMRRARKKANFFNNYREFSYKILQHYSYSLLIQFIVNLESLIALSTEVTKLRRFKNF